VVVNCSAGLNRSGLLVGRALIEHGHTPAEAVELVRAARGAHALSNVAFTQFLLLDCTPRRIAARRGARSA
jgi:protein-tyrosine phosphatase